MRPHVVAIHPHLITIGIPAYEPEPVMLADMVIDGAIIVGTIMTFRTVRTAYRLSLEPADGFLPV